MHLVDLALMGQSLDLDVCKLQGLIQPGNMGGLITRYQPIE